jgi:hypothetical protein
MTLLITTSDVDTLSRLYRDADEMAQKLRAELADLLTRGGILEGQIARLDAITRSLDATSRALAAAKPDALRVASEPGCDPGLLRGKP